jgi:hypothetical protein
MRTEAYMRGKIFILLVIILLIPLFFSIVKIDIIMKIDRPLDGAYESPERPEITPLNILNGSFQNDFEKYFNYNLRGRSTMTRIVNQVTYNLFRSTNNSSLLIGKDGYLFEPPYPQAYLGEPAESQQHDLYDKMTILASLQKTIEEMGKYLFVIITPNKASICPEYLPDDYHRYAALKSSTEEYSQNFYEYFVSHAGGIKLKYFDYHDKFLDLKKNGMDIFSKGGTHWNGPAVIEYFTDFVNVINEECKNKIGVIEKIEAAPVWGDAFMTDDDLEILLNLFPSYKRIENIPGFGIISSVYRRLFPRTQYYSYHMETLSMPTAYRPDVFVMGGSFNWTWLSMVYGVNGWVEHGEEAIFGETYMRFYTSFIQKYPENIRVSEAAIDFQDVMNKDILIIEFNEQVISPEAVQFTFAEDLLNYIGAIQD